MKEVNPRTNEVQTTGDRDSSDFSINEQALDMAMDAFTQYSNPIASIVREITSNGFDAHQRAAEIRDTDLSLEPFRRDISEDHIDYESLSGYRQWKHAEDYLRLWNHLQGWEDSGVTVRMSPQFADNKKIEIEDTGVGMAPRHSDVEPNIDIYTLFFASTKRDTNDALGFFGVGAKSPLGYTDLFEVETTWCGTTYHYVVSMGSNRPQIDLVDVEDTDAPNGTTVRISIDSTADWRKFRKAARQQLAYFPNVLFDGALQNEIDNEFRIYEGEDFIYRTDSPFNDLHLCIGGVYYPLDYEAVGLEKPKSYRKNGWDVPMALKFEIGEIEIVWNRENVKYTEDTVEKIKAKIKAVKEEIQDIYDDRFGDVNTVEEWLDAWKTARDRSLTLDDDVELTLTERFLNQTVPSLTKYEKILDTLPSDPFYVAKVHKKIDDGYVDQSNHNMNVQKKYFDNVDNMVWLEDSYTPKTNRYIAWEHDLSTFYLIKPSGLRDLPYDLDDEEERYQAERHYATRFADQSISPRKGRITVTDRKLKAMMKFEVEVLKAIKDECNIIYQNVERTDEFDDIDARRKQKTSSSSSSSTSTRKDNDRFPAKKYDNSGRYNSSDWSRTRIKWTKIEDPDLIVYGHRDDADALEEVGSLLTNFSAITPGRYSSSLDHDRAMVIKIAKTRAKYFEVLDTAVHVDNFFDRYWGFLRRYFTRKEVKDIVSTTNVPKLLKKQFPRVKTLTKRLNSELSTPGFRPSPSWTETFSQEDYIDPEYVRMAKELRGWLLKYPLFKAMKNYGDSKMPDQTNFQDEIESYINSKGHAHPSLYYRLHNHNQQT